MTKKNIFSYTFIFLSVIIVVYFFLLYLNRYSIGEIGAQVHVNIELQKEFSKAVSVKIHPEGRIITLAPTSDEHPSLSNIILHAEITGAKPGKTDFHVEQSERSGARLLTGLELVISEADYLKVFPAIDNIAVFIGNKCFYYSQNELSGLKSVSDSTFVYYNVGEELRYSKSFFGSWINYYGDLNFLVKSILAPLMYPWFFLPLYIFFLFIIYFQTKKNEFTFNFETFLKKKESIMVFALLVLAFLLRLNGYDKYSVESDELVSAVLAKPSFPLIKTFSDPGNPPLYYILLRFMYTVFGWTDRTGRILSVVIGTASIGGLYYLLRKYASLRTAFSASFLTVACKFHLIISHNTRCYILIILLAVVFTVLLINLFDNLNSQTFLLYVVTGCAIVNTHYYGVLIVIANYFFFLFHFKAKKYFPPKIFFKFTASNIIIAISFLPYFFMTAFSKALTNTSFNEWIPRLGLRKTFVYVSFVIIADTIYIVIRGIIKKMNIFVKYQKVLLDYSVFVCSAVFILALLISLVRPIFDLKYLQILFPFGIIGFVIILTLGFKSRPGIVFSSLLLFSSAVLFYHKTPTLTVADLSKETHIFITEDISSHIYNKPAVIEWYNRQDSFYSYGSASYFPLDSETFDITSADVIYVSPLFASAEELNKKLNFFGLKNMPYLKIKTDSTERSILKTYRK
jgi:hypothetical protein